jgi:hypothetical protein
MRRKKDNNQPECTKRKQAICEYTIYVLCLEAPAAHPGWVGKQWFRVDPTPWGLLSHNAGNHAWCVNAAEWIAGQIQEREGGVWTGVTRDCAGDPMPDQPMMNADILGCRRHILDGPDGPGRRFLLRHGEVAPVDHVAPVLPAWAQAVVGAGPEDAF